MIPTPGYAYLIKDEFFHLFGSPIVSKLCCNKGPGHMRPYYCCKRDYDSGLYWMIPLSTKIQKYAELNMNQKRIYGKCITITLAKYAGKSAAVLIQNAIPVHPEFIERPFLKNGNPVPLHTTVQRIVYGNLQQALAIHRAGGCIFFPNIDHIKQLQLTLEQRKFRLPLDFKISSANTRLAAPPVRSKEHDHTIFP